MENEGLNKKLTVLVLGYDPYKDVWPFFDYFFKKNCPELSNLAIFVSISEKFVNASNIANVTSQGKSDFSSRLLSGLNLVKTDYVLLLLEDYIVNEPINIRMLCRIIDEMGTSNYSFCELENFIRTPKLLKKKKEETIREIASPGHYRISLQPALWRKDFLLDLAKQKIDKPWDFEILLCGLYDKTRNGEKPKAGACLNNTINIVNFIDKGKITYQAFSLIRTNGFAIPKRPVQSHFEYLKSKLKIGLSKLVPQKMRKAIKNAKRKKGVHYFSDD